MLLDIVREDFRTTAEMVKWINRYVCDWSVEDIMDKMVEVAQDSFCRGITERNRPWGYVSTLGFVLTFFERQGSDVSWEVKASVSSETLKSYLHR